MIINKEQLISLLIAKSDLQRDQVEGQLSELIKRIQEAAEAGKTFEVEGFGTFGIQEGNLHFEPHDVLETEINNRYAGMKPIELIGAFKEPEGDEIPNVVEQLDAPEKGWAVEQATVDDTELPEEPVPDETEETGKESEVEEAKEPAEQDEEAPAEPAGVDAEKELQTGDESSEGETPGEKPLKKGSSEPKKQPRKVAAGESEEESDPLGKILVAAVVVLALGVGGWMLYDAGVFGDNSSPPNSGTVSGLVTGQEQMPSRSTDDSRQEPPQNPSSASNGANKTSEPEQGKEVVNDGDPHPQARTETVGEQSPYGLKGSVDQSISKGYTIVVHSLKSMKKAENRKKNLEQAGFRALINQAEVGGTTYFRVGIGQFQTVDDALQKLSEIPEPYRSNNFIKRIHNTPSN